MTVCPRPLYVMHRHVVLDEADHMLEKGFADQMDLILKECYSCEHQQWLWHCSPVCVCAYECSIAIQNT